MLPKYCCQNWHVLRQIFVLVRNRRACERLCLCFCGRDTASKTTFTLWVDGCQYTMNVFNLLGDPNQKLWSLLVLQADTESLVMDNKWVVYRKFINSIAIMIYFFFLVFTMNKRVAMWKRNQTKIESEKIPFFRNANKIKTTFWWCNIIVTSVVLLYSPSSAVQKLYAHPISTMNP